MKRLIQILTVVLALGATVQAVTSFVANAGTDRTHGGHEPGP